MEQRCLSCMQMIEGDNCPYCGYPLFDNKLDALKLKVKPFCPKCGERVEIEMEP